MGVMRTSVGAGPLVLSQNCSLFHSGQTRRYGAPYGDESLFRLSRHNLLAATAGCSPFCPPTTTASPPSAIATSVCRGAADLLRSSCLLPRRKARLKISCVCVFLTHHFKTQSEAAVALSITHNRQPLPLSSLTSSSSLLRRCAFTSHHFYPS